MIGRRPGLLATLLALWGCGVGAQATTPLPGPDRAGFEDAAGEILARRCGTSTCHGRAERPFSLFAPGQRRLPPTGTFARTPLGPAELDANYAATLGFLDAPRALETLLVEKSIGRAAHGGGPVFEHRSDPECQALRAWIETAP